MISREQLAKWMDEVNPQAAGLIRTPETVIEELAAPSLARGRIVKVSSRPPRRPVVFAIGIVDPDYRVMLGKNPAGYLELTARSGVRLDTEPLRIAHVTTFLETTCDLLSGFQILRSFDDIRMMNKPKPEERVRYDALRAKYGKTIRPPQASEQDPWTVTLFAVRSRNLVAIRVRVQPDGRIHPEEKVIEEAIPVPYTK